MAVLETSGVRKKRRSPDLEGDLRQLLARLGEVEGLEALEEHNLRDRRVCARLQLYLLAVESLESLLPLRAREELAAAVADGRLFVRHALASAEAAIAESEQPERVVEQWQHMLLAYWHDRDLPAFP